MFWQSLDHASHGLGEWLVYSRIVSEHGNRGLSRGEGQVWVFFGYQELAWPLDGGSRAAMSNLDCQGGHA